MLLSAAWHTPAKCTPALPTWWCILQTQIKLTQLTKVTLCCANKIKLLCAQASVDILLRHYPPRSTAVAAEQRLLAALLLALAAMPGSAKGGRAAAAAQVMELEAAAASTLALHFGL